MFVSIEYGHWGITVSKRHDKNDYAPYECKSFCYPVVNGYGPCETDIVKKEAVNYFNELKNKH